ncbi:hypothetical protein [Herbidospora daliensis]|uniref:hypothetical protein n=1 Tax=Herbidospora daliensis TaxID=295585 RepID=UPI0007817377|nr:hypothetical protein [Herbidospora daliensis]
MKSADDILFENGAPGSRDDEGRRRIDITLEDKAVLFISDALNSGIVPELYVRNGGLSRIVDLDDGTGPRLAIQPIDANGLRALLARHSACFRVRSTRLGPEETSGLPSVAVAKDVLSQPVWSGIPTLAGVATTPVVRADGSFLQDPGYDPATRLYLRPDFPHTPVEGAPDLPTIAAARRFLLDYVLADFVFDSPASRANFVGLLMTPLLRLFTQGVAPLGVISATTRGSGKSLLAEIIGSIYGWRMYPWPRKEEEMAKSITAILRDTTEPLVTWDNVDVFDTVEHASLAMLLTSTHFSSRILGVNSTFNGINDRLWCVTGNNVAVGGDIASRSVLVRLDPQMERPDLRTGFVIDDLWSWLRDDANRAKLLRALLVLTAAWMAAGAPRERDLKMRNFSAWAQTMGGFTRFHGIDGFMDNRHEMEQADDDEAATIAFLTKWHTKFGRQPQTAAQLLDSARVENLNGEMYDSWDGVFPSKPDGRPFTAKGLGKFLTSRRGRIFSGWKLVGEQSRTGVWHYHVDRVEQQQAGAA